MKFITPENWLNSPLRIAIIGAGGTGSEALDGLARMSMAIERLGGSPFQIAIFDGDEVSVSNVGRQRFAPADVGLNKAEVLAHRYILAFGLDIEAFPEMVSAEKAVNISGVDLFVTCTDSAKFRMEFAKAYADKSRNVGWLDFGNGSHTAQVVLGYESYQETVLPSVSDLYPELADVDDADEPSCSLEEAFAKQDFGINRMVADAGMTLIWNAIRHGYLEHHGVFIDMRKGVMQPLKIDAATWSFMGYEAKEETLSQLVGSLSDTPQAA